MTKFYKALWGMEGDLSSQLRQIQEARYSGFEAPVLPAEEKGRIADSGLDFVAMLFIEDAEALRHGLEQAAELGAVKATVHAGKDWWSFEDGCHFWEQALPVTKQFPFQVNFETHRARLLFEPQSTQKFLERFPDLSIVADFSHWTCVCSSLLQDQEVAVGTAIKHVGHIHARVGLEEGPQVPDPRAPQWERCVVQFESWWDRMREANPDVTVTPEFGPPNYMWTTVDGEPVANLWDVCLWMRDRLEARWS